MTQQDYKPKKPFKNQPAIFANYAIYVHVCQKKPFLPFRSLFAGKGLLPIYSMDTAW